MGEAGGAGDGENDEIKKTADDVNAIDGLFVSLFYFLMPFSIS